MLKQTIGLLLMMAVQCGLLLSLYAANTNVSKGKSQDSKLSGQLTKTIISEIEEEEISDKSSLQLTPFIILLQQQSNILPSLFLVSCTHSFSRHSYERNPIYICNHRLLI